MATKPLNYSDESIKKATGKSWPQWLKVFGDMGAAGMSHKDIAARLAGDFDIPGWWTQGLTVRFEQEIGRRVPGQTCEGGFQVSVTATKAVSMDKALALWRKKFDKYKDFDGVAITTGPAVSKSEKWRYWRVGLEDGSKVSLSFSNKAENKSLVAVGHDKLADSAAVERWRAFWKQVLNEAL